MVTRRTLLRRSAAAATVGSAGLAGCSGLNPDDGGPACETVDAEPNYGGWFDGVDTYRGTCDWRGADQQEVLVGAHGGLGYYRFVPTAVAVSAGATVRWRWTGRGGAHDVAARSEAFDSGDPVAEEGTTFEYTFQTPGTYTYYCTPHRNNGMRGAVYVTPE